MTRDLFKILLLTIFFATTFVANSIAVEKSQKATKVTTEEEDLLNEFKETKFLQLDQLELPKELKKIEDQIRQNSLDVIISSKTHTPVYAQKRPDGYTDSYKKFHGLEIRINPSPSKEDFYSLSFFYYNWTNRKFDKHLRKNISKYNVLNELRFGLYELLLGKKFVEDHKDEIEKQNYDRIQAVRKNEELQIRIDRKKKKLEKKKKDEDAIKVSLKEEDERNKLSRGEKDNKDTQDKSVSIALEETDEKNSISNTVNLKEVEDVKVEDLEDPEAPEKFKKRARGKSGRKTAKKFSQSTTKSNLEDTAQPPSPPLVAVDSPNIEKSVPVISSLYAFGNVFSDDVVSDGLLHSSTNLRYLGLGVRYIQEKQTESPWGMRFSLITGVPIKKENYILPVYRSFETEIYKNFFLKYFKIFAGIDFSPIYFVNLPNPGEGLSVFENDVFWLKGGIGVNREIFNKEIELRAIFFKSFITNSNQNKLLDGNSLALSAYYQHTKKHGGEIAFKKNEMVGDLSVSSQSLYFSYLYKFEN